MKLSKAIPMLVIDTTEMELHEHLAIKSFTSGHATEAQYDKLMRMMNMLLVAGQTCKARRHAISFSEAVIKPTLISIKSRFIKTGKLGTTSHELQSLKSMLKFNREFWIVQNTELWNFCNDQVDAFYLELEGNK